MIDEPVVAYGFVHGMVGPGEQLRGRISEARHVGADSSRGSVAAVVPAVVARMAMVARATRSRDGGDPRLARGPAQQRATHAVEPPRLDVRVGPDAEVYLKRESPGAIVAVDEAACDDVRVTVAVEVRDGCRAEASR